VALKMLALALLLLGAATAYGTVDHNARSEAAPDMDMRVVDGGSSEPGPVSTETPDPGPSSLQTAFEDAPQLTLGDSIAFPDNTTMIIETGCWSCDGPTEALYRVARHRGEAPRVDLLFEPDQSINEGAYITSFALKPDASEIVVAVCTSGYCGGLGYATPDAVATFYRSSDLGSSWHVIGASSDAMFAVAVTPRGIVLTFDYSTFWYNDGELLPKPGPDAELVFGSRRSGEVIWWLPQRRALVVPATGQTIRLPDASYDPETALNPGQPPLMVWSPDYDSRGGGPFPGFRLSTVARDGALASVASPLAFIMPAAWLADGLVVASVETPAPIEHEGRVFEFMRPIPSVIDFEAGVVHPIAGAFEPPIFRGRNRVVAVISTASHLRVEVEGCLPLRDRPRRNGPVIACAPPGTLLLPSGEQRYVPGQWFRGVWLADGRHAWAPAEGLR
jgi:hypothetical protein